MSFFEQQIAIAQKVHQDRLQARESKQRYENEKRARLQAVFDRFAAHILEGWKEKVARAASRGWYKTNLYSYHPQDRFEGYHPAFLLIGPKGAHGCWERDGYRSVLSQVDAALKAEGQAEIMHWFPGHVAGNVIEACWGAGDVRTIKAVNMVKQQRGLPIYMANDTCWA